MRHIKKTLIKLSLFLILWMAFIPFSYGQSLGTQTSRNKKRVSISFELHNNFIVLRAIVNGQLPLNFIYDTGARNIILTAPYVANALGLEYEREISIKGADQEKDIKAYIARMVDFDFGPIEAVDQGVIILKEDHFDLEPYVGIPIHGIIGGNIFKTFIVVINYQKQKMCFSKYSPDYKPVNQHIRLPLEIIKSKPYLNTTLVLDQQTPIPVKLLLDTGANLDLLLLTHTDPSLKPPEEIIRGSLGSGLGGELQGYLGRTATLSFGTLEIKEILTSFQVLPTALDTVFQDEKNGLIGNHLLSQFHIALDYIGGNLYLKPIKKSQRKAPYDKSGLQVRAIGANFNIFEIQSVVPSSPAAYAGIQAGDRILKLNGITYKKMDLDFIMKKLHGKEGKKIRMVIQRKGERRKVRFRLQTYI